MRNFLFFCLSLCSVTSFAQCTITICQTCGHKDFTILYKGGSEGATGVKANDSCKIYNIPISEPHKVAIVDDSTYHISHLWLAPQYKSNRNVLLNNCTGRLQRNDTIAIDIDDAPDQKIEEDYVAGKISTEDSFVYYCDNYEEGYIKSNPDSFLAVYYLKTLVAHLDINTAIKYRDLVAKNNGSYSAMTDIDNYIKNYRFKSIPSLGDSFFEFHARQTNGLLFDSKTISNKATVLFFWYSGCGPCHRAIQPLREMYTKYQSEGLEVISFSFDEKEDEWEKASSIYALPGINVTDFVGFNSPLFLHYAVSSFPFFVVFDKNKKISMVTFGNDEVPLIESKVKELLDIK